MDLIKPYRIIMMILCFVISTGALAAEFNNPDNSPATSRINIVSLDSMDLPEFLIEKSRSDIDQMQTAGFILATDEEVSELENYLKPANRQYLLGTDLDAADLSLTPADLGKSVLGRSVLLASATEGALTKAGWSGITRLFQIPGLDLVLFSELDIRDSDAYFTIARESINEDINGYPAVFTVRSSEKGKAISTLTWFTLQKRYTLKTSTKLLQGTEPYDSFKSIALSLD